MPKTDEAFHVYEQSRRTVTVVKPGVVTPLSRWARAALWLLNKTKHKVTSKIGEERVQVGIVHSRDVDKLLVNILTEYEFGLIYRGEVDRIIIDHETFSTLSNLEPWHSFSLHHEMALNHGSGIWPKLCGLYIQVLPNVKGVLFVPKFKFNQ